MAVGIASIKALLVAFIFMLLWFDRKIHLMIFSTAILMLMIFIALTMFETWNGGKFTRFPNSRLKKSCIL